MATERLTISLAPELRHWIDSAIETGGYSSASYFVATLVRNHRRGEQLDHLLAEGLASGPRITPDADYWADKKAALAQKNCSLTHQTGGVSDRPFPDPLWPNKNSQDGAPILSQFEPQNRLICRY